MRQVILLVAGVMAFAGWLYGVHHVHRARQTYWKRDAERWRNSIKALGGMAIAVSALVGLFAYVGGFG